MIVSSRRNGKTEEILVIVDCLNHSAKEEQKLGVFIRSLARSQKIHPCVGGHRPVIMLSGTVNACKRFFMKKTNHTMTRRYLLHDLHGQLVMVSCNIGSSINRSKLMLGRRYFVVLCFRQHAQLPQLVV